MKRLVGIFTGLLLITSCSTFTNIYSDYDRSIDFEQYKSFAWLPDSVTISTAVDTAKDPRYDNDIVRNNTKNYVNHCLGNRGYLVNSDTPDVVLQLVLLNENKERIITNPSYYYSDYYYNNRYYYPYYYPNYGYYTYSYWDYYPEYSYKQSYVKGTIILNMYDRKQKKLVWTGIAEGDIYDPAYLQYDIHPAVHEIIKQFPVDSKVKNKKGSSNASEKNIDRVNVRGG